MALACAAGILLRLWRAQEPAPFADSYYHWLVAARIAEGGGWLEPFSRADGAWPPLYSLLGAALLRLFGARSMAPLIGASVAFSAATTVAVALLARPRFDEEEARYRLAPALAAALFALCPLDILTSSTPAMEPAAVLFFVLHLLLAGRPGAPGIGAGLRELLAGLFLAAACLSRYEAWGYLALALPWALFGSLPSPPLRGSPSAPLRDRLGRILRLYGPALLACLLWLGAASLGLLYEKLAPEAARHTGAEEGASAGAVAGRILVFGQTLLLATGPLLPAALAAARRRAPLPAVDRLFAFGLLAALLSAVTLGLIAGSHRYLALALPLYAVLASRFWLGAARSWLAILLPLGCFALSGLGALAARRGVDMGQFWLYLQPWPLLCLLGAVLAAALLPRRPRAGAALAAAVAAALALAYLPILSSRELGKYVRPFRAAGQILAEEGGVGLVLVDNPIPAYFSGLPPLALWPANRPRDLAPLLGEGLVARLSRGEASEEELLRALREAGVSHLVSEEVPYLFTRQQLIPALPAGSLLPLYWTRQVVLREVAVFRLRSE